MPAPQHRRVEVVGGRARAGCPRVANSAVLDRLGLVLEQHDEHVAVAHQLDRAAAEVAALLGQPEVGEVDDRLRLRGEHRRPARGAERLGRAVAAHGDAPVPARGERARARRARGDSATYSLGLVGARASAYRLGSPGWMPAAIRISSARASRARSSSWRRSARRLRRVRLAAARPRARRRRRPRSSAGRPGPSRARSPGPTIRPLSPSTNDEVRRARARRSRPRPRTTSRRSRRRGARLAIADSLSASGPIVTIDEAGAAGQLEAAASANVSQKWRQVMQPLERNASSVGCGAPTTPTTTASPPGVEPATSVAVGRRRRPARGPGERRRAAPAWSTPGAAQRVAADAEVVQRAQDLGVAAQQPGHQEGEEREHDCLDHDQDQHLGRGYRTPTFSARSDRCGSACRASGEGLVEVGEEVVEGLDARPRAGRARGRRRAASPSAEAWVIRAGCSMSDSTAPSDSASVKTSVRGDELERGGLAAGGEEAHHPAEAAHLPRRDVVARVRRQARDTAPASTAGCASSISATARAFAQCRSIRTPSVLIPRSTR